MQKLDLLGERILQTRRTIQIVWRSGPVWFIFDILLVFLQSLPPLALIYFTKVMIDKLTAYLSQPATSVDQVFLSVVPVIAAVFVTMLIIAATRGLTAYVNTVQTQKIGEYVGDLILEKSLNLDLEFYENPKYQDIMYLTQQQAPTRLNGIVSNLIDVGQGLASGFTILALLWALSPLVVLILVAAVLPGTVLRFYLSRRNFRWQKQHTNQFRLMGYLSGLAASATSIKEVRLYSLGHHLLSRFRVIRSQLNGQILRITVISLIVEFLIQASATVAVISVFAYIVYLTAQHRITIGDMVLYYQVFQRGQNVLQGVVSSVTSFYDNGLYADAIYEFLDLPNKMPSIPPASARPFPTAIITGIRFEDVSFQYPGAATSTFESINLTINAGETVALVGSNGAGKTTLIKLLCRLYDPTSGRITIDGIDLREFSPEDLHRHIGIVFQDYLGYQLSAHDNIWFGNVNSPSEQAGVEAAARLSGIHDKLSSLKSGYDTHLGRWLDDGEQISIGEWQKVALARLFYRDAPIVVLDEPTSSMDARAEYSLFLKFREAIRGKTAILISHRLSTVRMADRIYVLENGAIAENGTHEELMIRNETYAELFKLQAQYYED